VQIFLYLYGMKTPFYQVDAFTNLLFSGNPAGVCPLEKWLPAETMQTIAMENNLSETAFFVRENDQYHIRWFTPATEVELCGHATLATAHVIFKHLNFSGDVIEFTSLSGILKVSRTRSRLTLDFPGDPVQPVEITPRVSECFPGHTFIAYKGKTDLMLVFENETTIHLLRPDMRLLREIPQRGVIVTARGDTVDFVSRFFCPQLGIDEDPVTGSAHTTLTPYWAGLLGKTELTAMQLSARQGWLTCSLHGERVAISGEAVTYLTGELTL
jgi:predicted PhzF superfamily epimerase YddE/YHI9